MIAYLMIPFHPRERFETFREGLKHIGFTVETRLEGEPNSQDILVVWNRKNESLCAFFESFGCKVIVAENGYLSDSAHRKYIALSLGDHNTGNFPVGDNFRFDRLEREIMPWSVNGDWVLVSTQRGIGSNAMRMPLSWPLEIEATLRQYTNRHIEKRLPPSRIGNQPSLYEQLDKSCCVVVWTSNVATTALLRGIPAFYCGPNHIMASALQRIEQIESPVFPDRYSAFCKLAWGQWLEEEIKTGEPIKRLLT